MTTIKASHPAGTLQLLATIETVLTHLSPQARKEITTILAEHADNHGGYQLLIDQVQFQASLINPNH